MSNDNAPAEKTAECRNCRRRLKGKPYYMGGSAYDPETGKRCPISFYGGFVCSERCDYAAALNLEQTMPGHGITQKTVLPETARRIKENWP